MCAQTLPGHDQAARRSRCRSAAAGSAAVAADDPAVVDRPGRRARRPAVGASGRRSRRSAAGSSLGSRGDRTRPAPAPGRGTGQPRDRGPRGRRVAHRQAASGGRRRRRGARRPPRRPSGRGPPRRRPSRRTGPRAAAPRSRMHSTGGIPAAGMIPSDFSVSVTGHAVDDVVRLAQRVAEAHVDAALDLALEDQRVDRPADVLRRDDPLDPAVVVEDDHLRRPAVGEVGHRLRVAPVGRGRPVDDELARELATGQVRQASRRRARREAGASRRGRPGRRGSSPATRSSRRCRARARCRRRRGRGRRRRRAPRRRSGAARCGSPAPSPSRSGTASACRRARGAGSRGRAR